MAKRKGLIQNNRPANSPKVAISMAATEDSLPCADCGLPFDKGERMTALTLADNRGSGYLHDACAIKRGAILEPATGQKATKRAKTAEPKPAVAKKPVAGKPEQAKKKPPAKAKKEPAKADKSKKK